MTVIAQRPATPTGTTTSPPLAILGAAVAARRLRAATIVLAVIGALGGTVTLLAVRSVATVPTSVADLMHIGSVLSATVGTFGVLVLLVLIGRLPALERAVGHDRLVVWHRLLAPWATGLIGLHVALSVAAAALPTGVSWPTEGWQMITSIAWLLPAAAGLGLIVTAAVTSWKRARGRLRHQTWWTIHLYTYLGIALAFAHQILTGGPFVTGPARTLWIALYLATLGALGWSRVVVPLWRSCLHDLRVSAVHRETGDVVSVWITGQNLHRLRIEPGQFFNWRFWWPGMAYEAHPYSVSGHTGDALRITVKALGDSSAALAHVPIGTRVLIEGPYGVMSPATMTASRAVLVAAGVGIAPIAAIADALGGRVPLDIVYRASSARDLALEAELTALTARRGVRLHLLPGSRRERPLDVAHLGALVGRLDTAEIYLCGPAGFTTAVRASALALGAGDDRIHHEEFGL